MYINLAQFLIPKISSICSFLINPFTVYIVWNDKKLQLGNYRYLLLYFAIFNMCTSLMDMLVPMVGIWILRNGVQFDYFSVRLELSLCIFRFHIRWIFRAGTSQVWKSCPDNFVSNFSSLNSIKSSLLSDAVLYQEPMQFYMPTFFIDSLFYSTINFSLDTSCLMGYLLLFCIATFTLFTGQFTVIITVVEIILDVFIYETQCLNIMEKMR